MAAPGTSWTRIHDDLIQQIRDGQLPIGAKIPSTRELAAQHGTSLKPPQRAVAELKRAGVLAGTAGLGVFVRAAPDDATPEPDPVARLEQWVAELTATVEELSRRVQDLEGARTSTSRRRSSP